MHKHGEQILSDWHPHLQSHWGSTLMLKVKTQIFIDILSMTLSRQHSPPWNSITPQSKQADNFFYSSFLIKNVCLQSAKTIHLLVTLKQKNMEIINISIFLYLRSLLFFIGNKLCLMESTVLNTDIESKYEIQYNLISE